MVAPAITQTKEGITMGKFDVLLAALDKIPQEGIKLEVVSALHNVAMAEIRERKAQQVAGIAKSQEEGVAFGRPKIMVPENFRQVADLYNSKKVTIEAALELTGLKRSTFCRMLREHRQNLGTGAR